MRNKTIYAEGLIPVARFPGRLAVRIVTAGAGDSAVSKAAYNSRSQLRNERLGKWDDYRRNGLDCLYAKLYVPAAAPDWARDRNTFWNRLEYFELKKRRDAQLARELVISLPFELSVKQAQQAIENVAEQCFTSQGCAVDVAIHGPPAYGDQRNVHAHMLVALRRVDGRGFAPRKERLSLWERFLQLDGWKRAIERLINRELVLAGNCPHYDLRSLADRGIDAEPTIHLGKAAAALQRRGIETEPGRMNREIEERNRLRMELLSSQRLHPGDHNLTVTTNARVRGRRR